MLRFLHAADLHLDSPIRSLPPERAIQRRAELRALPGLLCDLAREQDCQLLLLSGDLFDAVGGYPETIEALIRAFSACPAQIFIAPGNHDFYASASPYELERWPENVHIFRSETPEAVSLPDLGVTVWGAAFRGEHAGPLLSGFHAPQDGQIHLMVLHGDPESPQGPYNPISADQIAASGLSYLALGHIHARSELRYAGSVPYAWPGCPMGRGFDEAGEKGVYLGELDESGLRLRFYPLPGRRYELLRVEAGSDPLAAIQAALPETPTLPHAYRITLTGEAEPPDLGTLHAALDARFFSLTLRDETHPPQDLWAGTGEDTLKGLLLSALFAQAQSTQGADLRRVELAARYARAALEGREVPQP